MPIRKIVICSLLAACVTVGAEQSGDGHDGQCRKQVDETVQQLDLHTRQSGTEQKLRDLTADAIRKIQQDAGDCAALREINKRRMHG